MLNSAVFRFLKRVVVSLATLLLAASMAPALARTPASANNCAGVTLQFADNAAWTGSDRHCQKSDGHSGQTGASPLASTYAPCSCCHGETPETVWGGESDVVATQMSMCSTASWRQKESVPLKTTEPGTREGWRGLGWHAGWHAVLGV